MKKLLIILILIMPVGFILAGCAMYDLPFFEGWSAEQLVIGGITGLLVISQALFPKISLMQRLKVYLPWLQDEVAYYITIASLFGVSALALWITGEYDPDVVWTLDTVIYYYGILMTISQAAWARLKASGKSKLPA